MTTLERGQALFAALKGATRAGEPPLVIPVGVPVRALLRPVASVAGALSPQDVALLTLWRNRHVRSFLTEFVATDERTANWLSTAVHADPGKMLFMVDSPDGHSLGHVGLGFINWTTGYGEADAIVSGGSSPPGLMKASLLALMTWSKDVLGLKTLYVRVRSDNSAVEFYRKVGFVEQQRVPIVPSPVADGVHWREDAGAVNAPASLVHMQLSL